MFWCFAPWSHWWHYSIHPKPLVLFPLLHFTTVWRLPQLKNGKSNKNPSYDSVNDVEKPELGRNKAFLLAECL